MIASVGEGKVSVGCDFDHNPAIVAVRLDSAMKEGYFGKWQWEALLTQGDWVRFSIGWVGNGSLRGMFCLDVKEVNPSCPLPSKQQN